MLVADDYTPMRLGVRALLEQQGFQVCAEAADAAGAVEAALRERPDVCVLDVKMPGDGIVAAQTISSRLPESGIVMLTVSRDDADFLNSLRAGASGYVLKETDPERLPTVLRAVVQGDTAYPRRLLERLLAHLEDRNRRDRVLGALGVGLTTREREIAQLLRDGKSTTEIAKELFVAPVTVRTHVAAILKKLGVSTREEALSLLEEQ